MVGLNRLAAIWLCLMLQNMLWKAWTYNMTNGPFRSVFLGCGAAFAVCVAAVLFACVPACRAQAFERAPESGPVAHKNDAARAANGSSSATPNKAWPVATMTYEAPRYRAVIYYPQLGHDIIDEELASWADARMRTFCVGAARLGEGKSCYTMNIDYSTSQPSSRFASVVFRVSTETGGLRPDMGLTTFTYDLERGVALSYGDIFQDAQGLLLFLSEYSREELMLRLGRFQRDLVERGTAPNEANFAYFILRSDGLEILFPPYQVAPSNLGEQNVVVPLEKLMPYGPDLSIWGRKSVKK